MDLAQLTRDLEALQAEAIAAAADAPDVATLEALELDILGKKGRLTAILRGIGQLPAEDRPRVGAVANTVRTAIETALADRGTALRGSELEARLAAEAVDVTLPGRPVRRGTLHPINETIGSDVNGDRDNNDRPVRGVHDLTRPIVSDVGSKHKDSSSASGRRRARR